MQATRWLASLLAAVVAAPMAVGQSFNIDVNIAAGAGAGPPAATYGGAASQPGVWQTLGNATSGLPVILNGLNGAATTATLTTNANLTVITSTTNGLGTPGDAQNLLSDIWDLGGTTQPQRSFTFNNLMNGVYDVYVYAMAPDSAAFRTRVNVNANAGAADPGVQVVGGAYTGTFVQGITHSLHTNAMVTAGSLVVNTTNAVSFGSLAGFQLVLVPGPGGLAMFGLVGIVARRRRRRD